VKSRREHQELLRNAELSNAELLVGSLNEHTVGALNEFVSECESGGFRSKYKVIAFARSKTRLVAKFPL
jgi:hypothetical protein